MRPLGRRDVSVAYRSSCDQRSSGWEFFRHQPQHDELLQAGHRRRRRCSAISSTVWRAVRRQDHAGFFSDYRLRPDRKLTAFSTIDRGQQQGVCGGRSRPPPASSTPPARPIPVTSFARESSADCRSRTCPASNNTGAAGSRATPTRRAARSSGRPSVSAFARYGWRDLATDDQPATAAVGAASRHICAQQAARHGRDDCDDGQSLLEVRFGSPQAGKPPATWLGKRARRVQTSQPAGRSANRRRPTHSDHQLSDLGARRPSRGSFPRSGIRK